MGAIVEVEKLSKSFNGKKAVNNISFSVNKGEVFGILGPNGAGKTTTLEMIEALQPIDKGSARIDGIDVQKNPQKIRQIIGVQPQSPAFQDKTKLVEILELFAAAYGEKAHPRKLLGDVDLLAKSNSFVEQLSGGQKQRFSIAAALVHSPKVLFMDEPTTGLDPGARRNLWELVNKIKSNGVTVIITTHYMEEAEYLCDRVAIMDKGKIITIDSPANLVSKLLKSGFKKRRKVEQANLEDVFIDLTGKHLND